MPDDAVELKIQAPVVHTHGLYVTEFAGKLVRIENGRVWICYETSPGEYIWCEVQMPPHP